jgi:hypothetical protein
VSKVMTLENGDSTMEEIKKPVDITQEELVVAE